VIATGARYRKLDVPRIDELTGLGVYYAATAMEAAMCEHSNVAIVGGGNSAGQAAMFLSRKVSRVTLMIRGTDLSRTMSRYLIDQIERTGNIEVRTSTQVDELLGDRGLEGVMLTNGSGQRTRLDVKALFVFIGADPRTGWLTEEVMVDGKGFVLTGPELVGAAADLGSVQPLSLETSAPGVFAVGDVRSGSVKRVASAVGEGSMAVRLVHEHLADA
jgi:thioredoxin reductase (NADPH)